MKNFIFFENLLLSVCWVEFKTLFLALWYTYWPALTKFVYNVAHASQKELPTSVLKALDIFVHLYIFNLQSYLVS